MTFPISVTYQGLPPSPALNADIQLHATRLERFAPRLQSCRVTVRRNECRHNTGESFLVTVHATLPGGEFNAGKASRASNKDEDVYVAAREAIDALRRQLEDFVRIQRND